MANFTCVTPETQSSHSALSVFSQNHIDQKYSVPHATQSIKLLQSFESISSKKRKEKKIL